jgi:hypothetical protein
MTVADGKAREVLHVTWKNGRHKATLAANLGDMSFEIIATREGERDGELHHFKCVHARTCPQPATPPCMLALHARLSLASSMLTDCSMQRRRAVCTV